MLVQVQEYPRSLDVREVRGTPRRRRTCGDICFIVEFIPCRERVLSDWMPYPTQPTARVCEPGETSSGRVLRHSHFSLHVRGLGHPVPRRSPYLRPGSRPVDLRISSDGRSGGSKGKPALRHVICVGRVGDVSGYFISTEVFGEYLAKLAS